MVATLFFHYIRWHYTQAIHDLLGVVRNFLWFFTEFFSIPLLLRTLFVPFRRIEEHARQGLDLEALLESFVINTLMRLVGALLRTGVIILGLFSIFMTCVIGLCMLICWLMAPLIVVSLVGMSLIFLRY